MEEKKEKKEKSKGKRIAEQNLISLADRPLEERRAIARKSVEARKKNKERKMVLQECMRQLLNMKVNTSKKKEILKKFGFEDKEITNGALLMVALFQKGTTGDVPAIREIVAMMDKLDMLKQTGKIQNEVTINLVAQGEVYQPNEQDEKEIWDVENSSDWMEEEENDEWGDEIYNG